MPSAPKFRPAWKGSWARPRRSSTSDDRQTLTLSSGEEISARLIILANGLNSALRENFGLRRRDISPGHSISIGFDLEPADATTFPFTALTCFPKNPDTRIAYLSCFPTGATTRANLFVYRQMNDPWLRAMRDAPVETLFAALPGLRRFVGNIAVDGPVKIRPADLYETTGLDKPGVVVVGDAHSTSCPAAGTGTGKVFVDVERLCNVYIPKWLASPGMDAAKIGAFYADPMKAAYDIQSRNRAFRVRDISINSGISWEARRRLRFAAHVGLGIARRARQFVAGKPAGGTAASVGGSKA